MIEVAVDWNIGIPQIYIGSGTELLRELICDGILDPSSSKLAMSNGLGASHEVNGKCGSSGEVLGPVHLLDAVIESIGIWTLEAVQAYKNSTG
jgi:hypothetical protein